MNSASNFGQNQWLVDALYQQWQENPSSVDKEWQELFAKDAVIASREPAREATPRSADDEAPAPGASAPRASLFRPLTPPAREATQAKKRPAASPMDEVKDYPGQSETRLKGSLKAIAKNMTESLTIPTATTVRDMPARLMFENRAIINAHLKATGKGKVSFTHIIGYTLVKATQVHPAMNVRYEELNGKPTVVMPEHINLGLAIDLPQKDGSRVLVQAAIKECERLDFREFVDAYEDIVRRARDGKLTLEDFQGITIALTNPGGIGTRHSIARLAQGMGAIIGVGAMNYPAEYAGTSAERLAELGVGKLVTMSSTYDHRVIQGAESGELLREISRLLIDDKFYDDIFASLAIPQAPLRWAQDLPDTGLAKSTRVMRLIDAYRAHGHLIADTNPLRITQDVAVPDRRALELEYHGLTIWDLDRTFYVDGFAGRETMTLREVLNRLQAAYTRTVGAELAHLSNTDERDWLQSRLENGMPAATEDEERHIIDRLNAAESFEHFLQTKYVGQKRFSLEGGESLIPLLDAALEAAVGQGIEEAVIGMPHRGRLNVLVNIVGKPLGDVFEEFAGVLTNGQVGGSGDVKYHLGYTGRHRQAFGDRELQVTLLSNPSHLEAVDPVLEGYVKARAGLPDGHPVIPLMLHGDASFAGLGVVQETLNMQRIDGYATGGTVHVVVNNQVGFTTTPGASRSTLYATDLAKGYDCPIFHVNGDDPEAAAWVAGLAVEYRRLFHKDVVIDLICYRLHGHNEADDPSLTQPRLYSLIADHPSVRESYARTLIGRGRFTEEADKEAMSALTRRAESIYEATKPATISPQTGIAAAQRHEDTPTAISPTELATIADAFAQPGGEGFTAHKRVKKVLAHRVASATEGGIDWAWGELIALGSLAIAGRRVRLAGEDSRRGTFTQRHAILFDAQTGREANPLDDLARATRNGGSVEIINSPLTEFAGLGFEYGFSLGDPDAIVAWEAQFGDFANGGQTIIDSFIAAGEAKWGQVSRLIMLLPHGYEGQGPDHSSARIERYLQLAAEDAITLAQPSTPANYFHLLRRQALGPVARPLVVFTPKSMLRNKLAVSSPEEFTEIPSFRPVIDDPSQVDHAGRRLGDPDAVRRIILVSGKLYWDIEKRRRDEGRTDLAAIRIEQLAPLPATELRQAIAGYPKANEILFCQDEPANQGPWSYYHEHLDAAITGGLPLRRMSRRPQSSTATGIAKVHQLEQQALLDEIFG